MQWSCKQQWTSRSCSVLVYCWWIFCCPSRCRNSSYVILLLTQDVVSLGLGESQNLWQLRGRMCCAPFAWPLHSTVEKMSSDSDISVAQLGNGLTTCCSNWLFRAWKWEEKNRFWLGMLLISWGSRYVSEVIHPCCTEPCLDTQLFNCMFYMIVSKEVLGKEGFHFFT